MLTVSTTVHNTLVLQLTYHTLHTDATAITFPTLRIAITLHYQTLQTATITLPYQTLQTATTVSLQYTAYCS